VPSIAPAGPSSLPPRRPGRGTHQQRSRLAKTLQGHTTDGEPATIIVTRQGLDHAGRVWLTFDGAIKTTLVLTDQEATGLVGLVSDATGAR